jgi:serine/threonine protein kinase
VVSWSGRGTYGTVYRVERRGHERQGSYALKLALHPRDERFEREAELLSRIKHPSVPRLEGRGVWQHASGNFPYLVMQWVAGVPLYQWAARRNPTSRQVLRLLAQVARALEATAAAGGVHRDVKGDNVMVRVADGQAFLTDFGAGFYRGAATLTWQPLPPATPNYRSPEAWAHQRLFAFHPYAHYRGSPCDDLFALGVTAYRLVTDKYPPPTEPDLEGAEVWARKGPGPRPPRELNAHVSTELNALIMRLLAQPQRRFKGSPRQAAEALEHAVEHEGPEADTPLFEWETVEPSAWSREEQRLAEMLGHRPRRRDRATAQRAEQQDAEARTEAARVQEQEKTLGRSRLYLWLVLPGIGVLVIATGDRNESAHPVEAPAEAQAEARDKGSRDAGTDGVGEEALTTLSVDPMARLSWTGVAMGMPKGPFPNQRKPPCELRGEIEIRGGCWLVHDSMRPPCKAGYYEWDEGCYQPSMSPQRQPTSDPP